MCLHGTYKVVRVINPNQNKKQVVVDACIANEIIHLNNLGVVTLGSCCGHGKAGQIAEWENDYGKWKSYYEMPHVLISEQSIDLIGELGYRAAPYYYVDGTTEGIWKTTLKSGCITENDCKSWHRANGIPFISNSGVMEK